MLQIGRKASEYLDEVADSSLGGTEIGICFFTSLFFRLASWLLILVSFFPKLV